MNKYPNIRNWLLSHDEQPSHFEFCGGSVTVFSRTSPNKTTSNEDAAAIIELAPNHGVLVVADGMGGAKAGDRASKCLVETITQSLSPADLGDDTARSQLLDAIEIANKKVLSWGIGAGATLVVVEYLRGTIRTFHIGDATAMVCSNRGRVKSLTVAHAPVAMAVEAGVLEEDEAMMHDDRHLISNCVGSAEMKIELGPIQKMATRDTLLLGSDGLFDNLTTDEIADLVRAGNLQRQFNLLIDKTRRQMLFSENLPSKPDDLTVICFRQ